MRPAPVFLGTALAVTEQSLAASYFLDPTNLEQAPFTDGPRYLAVTTAASGNDISFTVDVLNGPGQPFKGIEGSNFGIQQFGFNLANDNGASLEADNFTGLPERRFQSDLEWLRPLRCRLVGHRERTSNPSDL